MLYNCYMETLKSKKYVFFDLDGTITDSYPAITTSFLYAIKEDFPFAKLSERDLSSIIGPPLKDSFMRLFDVDGFKAWELVEKYREYYNNGGLYNCTVYEGMEDLFKNLIDAGKTLVVCTSKPEVQAKKVLEHFDLLKYFTLVAGDDESCSRSPKDIVLKYCLDLLGDVSLDDVIMVGDRSYDVKGSLKVGVTPVGVTYGYGSLKELKESGAKYIASNLEELKRMLI